MSSYDPRQQYSNQEEVEPQEPQDVSKIPKRRPLRPQLLIACVCWTIALLCGINVGHSAVLVPSLQKNDSGLVVDDEMGSWITSIFSTMKPVGCIVGGITTDKWGRCTTLKMTMMLFILGWVLIASASSATLVIAGRVILGIVTGMAADAIIALMDEAADSHWRGLAVTLAVLALVIGIEVVLGLAAIMGWRVLAGVIAISPVPLVVSLFFVPESPIWLMRHGKPEEATKVLIWLWTNRKKTYAYQESEALQTRCISDKGHNNLFSSSVLKPFFIAHFFNFIQIFCGTTMFVFYTVDIIAKTLNESEIVLEALTVASIAGLIRTVSLLGTCGLMMIVGRRPIAVASSFSTGVCAVLIGAILITNSKQIILSPRSEAWLCLALLFGYILCSTPGLFLLPASMLGEIVPSRVRGIASGYIFAANDVGLSGMLKVYPQMISAIGVSGLFLMFGISSLVCGVFVFMFLPETRNLSLNEIEDNFRSNNILWRRKSRWSKTITINEEENAPTNTNIPTINEEENAPTNTNIPMELV